VELSMPQKDPIPQQELLINLMKVLHLNIRIYLFGSHAPGTNAVRSDIDLAFDIGRRMTASEKMQIINIIDARNIHQTVDVIDLHGIKEDLKKIITNEMIE